MRGFTISEILIGTYYRSSHGKRGIVVDARKRDDVYGADNAYAILVEQVDEIGRPYNRLVAKPFWATIFVEAG